jgi:4-diphosphocytidyl-2C-methyl-D-erythritol kinase
VTDGPMNGPVGLPPATAVVAAPAKVNLFLRVLGLRDDGFHDLETLLVPIGLADRLVIHAFGDPEMFGTLALSLDVTGEPELVRGVPVGETNLVLRAARELAEAGGVRGFADVVLEKRVPPAAGLAGGSGDAAATLRALNDLWALTLPDERLMEIGAAIGSDVPAMLVGGGALARGRGERVEPFPVAAFDWAIATFSFGVSTADAFRWWDEDGAATGPDPSAIADAVGPRTIEARGDLSELRPLLFNDLEAPVMRRQSRVREARDRLLEGGAAVALMSGSGPSVAAILHRGAGRLDEATERDLERICGRPLVYTSSPGG